MAIYRAPNFCPFCGVLIKEVHQHNTEHCNIGDTFIGDTFIRYEDHTCDDTTQAYKDWLHEMYIFRNSPEGKKYAKEMNALINKLDILTNKK